MLTCSAITHRYGRREVLHGVTLCAGQGIHGLLGNNGAGKSTLMKIVATALRPTGGQVALDDLVRPRDDRAIRQVLGYLPQQYGLPPNVSCQDFLRYAAVMKGHDPDQPSASPQVLLERVGLGGIGTRRIGSLSGGLRQRLALAQALLGEPRLLVLDEPTAGLDPEERVRFRALIREVQGDATVLLSTHIVSDIERDAARVTILHDGITCAEGTPHELSEAARGHVFEVSLSPSDWQRLSPLWMRRDRDVNIWPGMVAGVSTVDATSDTVSVRVVSKALPEGKAEEATPTLEDAYLFFTGQHMAAGQIA